MFDNDTQLMVSIFQRVFQLAGSVERVPETYVKTYQSDIQEAGQLFTWLGLAKPDAKSPLGWRPTHDLLDVIAKRAVRPSKPVDREVREDDSLVFSLLLDAAFGEGRDRDCPPVCAFKVLNALGL